MAKAVVTLSITPQELLVILEALRMWAYVCKGIRDKREHPLAGYQSDLSMVDNNPSYGIHTANGIRGDIR